MLKENSKKPIKRIDENSNGYQRFNNEDDDDDDDQNKHSKEDYQSTVSSTSPH